VRIEALRETFKASLCAINGAWQLREVQRAKMKPIVCTAKKHHRAIPADGAIRHKSYKIAPKY